MWSLPGAYEFRIKVFLVLLVFFLASAITVNFYLLMTSRDAVRDEVGQRIVLLGEAARLELGISPGSLPPATGGGEGMAGQPRLARVARSHDLNSVELLDPSGKVLASSLVGRMGVADREFTALPAATRRKLELGSGALGEVRDQEGIAYAALSGFLPLRGDSGRLAAVLKVEQPVGDLARLDRSLKMLAGIQASGLLCLVLLVLLFARWLLTP